MHYMCRAFAQMPNCRLTLLIGQYAQAYFLRQNHKRTLTETVQSWRDYLPEYIVMPHPSPRNNIWLKKNPWFEADLVPKLRTIVGKLL